MLLRSTRLQRKGGDLLGRGRSALARAAAVIQPQSRDRQGCGQNFKSDLQPEYSVLQGTDFHGANNETATLDIFSGGRAWEGLTYTAAWPP